MTVNKTTAEGMWKTVFGKLENTVPEYAGYTKLFPFKRQARTGKNYEFPIRVRRSHGVTFKSGDDSFDAFTLNDPVTGQTKTAQVSGASLVIRERMGHKATMAALAEGEQAFANLYGETVADTYNTLGFYQEASVIYGQTDFGVIDTGGAASTGATQDFVLSAASSAPGLWAQMEGAKIDVWSTGFAAQRNSSNDMTVNAISFDLATGKVTLNVTGNASEMNAVTDTDVVVPKGWYDSSNGHQSFAGLDKIITNTGSLFGIDAASYPTWAGSTFGAGSAELSFQKLTKAQVLIAVRCGLSEEPLDCRISPMTWADLNNNTAALKRIAEKGGGKVELGASELIYHGVTGPMRISAHPMIKGGEAFVGMPKKVVRGGVTDITFQYASSVREGQATRFLRELENSNGFEFRGMWDNFLIIPKPRAWVKITGITNSI